MNATWVRLDAAAARRVLQRLVEMDALGPADHARVERILELAAATGRAAEEAVLDDLFPLTGNGARGSEGELQKARQHAFRAFCSRVRTRSARRGVPLEVARGEVGDGGEREVWLAVPPAGASEAPVTLADLSSRLTAVEAAVLRQGSIVPLGSVEAAVSHIIEGSRRARSLAHASLSPPIATRTEDPDRPDQRVFVEFSEAMREVVAEQKWLRYLANIEDPVRARRIIDLHLQPSGPDGSERVFHRLPRFSAAYYPPGTLGAPMLNFFVLEYDSGAKELVLMCRGPRLPGQVWVDTPFLITYPQLVGALEGYFDYLWSCARVITTEDDLEPLRRAVAPEK